MSASDEIARLDMVEKEHIEDLLKAPVVPTPKSSDNGKVLTVANSKLKWQNAGGGMVVHIDVSDEAYTMDTTYADIMTAINGGVMPVFIADLLGIFFYPAGFAEEDDGCILAMNYYLDIQCVHMVFACENESGYPTGVPDDLSSR